jgi:hypothetical protein
MAIDTEAKRKSCIGLALPMLRPGVVPDGSDLSAAQRLHVDGLYSGIAAAAPPAAGDAIGGVFRSGVFGGRVLRAGGRR